MKAPKLLTQVRIELRTRHYSLKTERDYVKWIRNYILFHQKQHPKTLNEVHINQYLSHLAVDRHVSASTQNQALCALVFLYKHVLKMDLDDFGPMVWAKKSQRIPVVLSKKEVKLVLSFLHGKSWLIANLLYGSGLRLIECLRLRIKDIDFDYLQVNVWEAKGAKCRVTMLPKTIVTPLKKHLSNIKKQHDKDLNSGYGSVELPHALVRKYPHAAREWKWQFTR